jgi:hypothetical protein
MPIVWHSSKVNVYVLFTVVNKQVLNHKDKEERIKWKVSYFKIAYFDINFE